MLSLLKDYFDEEFYLVQTKRLTLNPILFIFQITKNRLK